MNRTTHNQTDHLVQKSVTLDFNAVSHAIVKYFRPVDGPAPIHIRPLIATICRESVEIMPALKYA